MNSAQIKKTEKLNLNHFMQGLIKRNPGEVEFHQAVEEVATTVIPFINENETIKNRSINFSFHFIFLSFKVIIFLKC